MGRKSGRGSQLRRAAQLKSKRSARGASPTPTPDPDGTRAAADAVDTAASVPIAPAPTAPRAMSLSESDDDGRRGDGRAPRPALSLSASASPERNAGGGGDKAPQAAAPAPAAPRPRPTAYDVGEGAPPFAEGQIAKFRSELATVAAALAPTDADTAAASAAATVALAALSTLDGGITASLALPPPAPALTHSGAVGVALVGVPADGAETALAAAAAALKSAADGAAFTGVELLKGGEGEPRVRAVAAPVGEGGAVATVNVVVAASPPPADTTDPLATAFSTHPAAGPAARTLDALLRARGLMADGPRGGGGAPPRALAALVAAHAAAVASAGGDTSADAAADLVLSFCRRVGMLDASMTAVDASGAFVDRADAVAWAAAPPPPPRAPPRGR